MYEKLNIPALGVVENMSYFECPQCRHPSNIFGHGGGEQMAEQMGVPFLGRLPIYEPIRVGSDVGIPLFIAEPESGAAQAFAAVASQAAAQVSMRALKSEMDQKGRIPLTPIR
jgi:ATP-binding protein involved in chromosome partitioning